MSWVKRLATSGLREMIKALETEIDGLYKDLEELSHNRKYNWSERYAVLTAYDWVNEHAIKLKNVYLNYADRYPDDLRKDLERVIQKLDELNIFITGSFADVFNSNVEPVLD
jgi:chromosome segregation ATPase